MADTSPEQHRFFLGTEECWKRQFLRTNEVEHSPVVLFLDTQRDAAGRDQVLEKIEKVHLDVCHHDAVGGDVSRLRSGTSDDRHGVRIDRHLHFFVFCATSIDAVCHLRGSNSHRRQLHRRLRHMSLCVYPCLDPVVVLYHAPSNFALDKNRSPRPFCPLLSTSDHLSLESCRRFCVCVRVSLDSSLPVASRTKNPESCPRRRGYCAGSASRLPCSLCASSNDVKTKGNDVVRRWPMKLRSNNARSTEKFSRYWIQHLLSPPVSAVYCARERAQ